MQMTGNPNGKASSSPKFYFSPSALRAHTHLGCHIGVGKADLFFKYPSLEPLSSFQNRHLQTLKPPSYLSERQNKNIIFLFVFLSQAKLQMSFVLVSSLMERIAAYSV